MFPPACVPSQPAQVGTGHPCAGPGCQDLPGPHLPQQPGLGKAGQVPKSPKVCAEILSLVPAPAPSRAPEVHIFIPSYVSGVVAPQISAPWITSRLGSEEKTRVTGAWPGDPTQPCSITSRAHFVTTMMIVQPNTPRLSSTARPHCHRAPKTEGDSQGGPGNQKVRRESSTG